MAFSGRERIGVIGRDRKLDRWSSPLWNKKSLKVWKRKQGNLSRIFVEHLPRVEDFLSGGVCHNQGAGYRKSFKTTTKKGLFFKQYFWQKSLSEGFPAARRAAVAEIMSKKWNFEPAQPADTWAKVPFLRFFLGPKCFLRESVFLGPRKVRHIWTHR